MGIYYITKCSFQAFVLIPAAATYTSIYTILLNTYLLLLLLLLSGEVRLLDEVLGAASGGAV